MRSLFLLVAILSMTLVMPSAASTFHVDAVVGSDRDEGSSESPWQTIQHGASQLQPGDLLLVHAGVYREAVTLSVAGTLAEPIAIQGEGGVVLESPDATASLSAFDIGGICDYLEISGFEARGGYHEAVFVRPGAQRVLIRDCSVHDNRAGIWISGASEIEVEGCEVYDNGASGIRIFGDSFGVVVRDTTSRGNDDGAACLGDADGFTVEAPASGVVFERCVAEANGEDGFDLQGGGVTIFASRSLSNGCAGVKLSGDATIDASLIAGNRTGLMTSLQSADQLISMFNSVVADNIGTQILIRNAATAGGYRVLLRNVVALGEGKSLEVEAGVSLLEDHNIFFRPSTTERVIVVHQPAGEALRYSGQAINAGVWASASGGGEGTWAIDPIFADSGDYHCGLSSPMNDTGKAAGAAAEDLDGMSRPLGGAIDRGAYEHPLAQENQLPWPDPGPNRQVLVGGHLEFRAYGSLDPDGDPLSFTWGFSDDDSTASGYSASHTFSQLGQYLVSLTASDGQSDRTRIAQVSVLEEWPNATPTATATATPTPDTRGCPLEPMTGCLESSRSVLKLGDRKPHGPSDRDRMVWKWLRGPAMDRTEWGSPVDGVTQYSVCVYDQSGLQTALEVAAPSGCLKDGCWRENAKGFTFRDGKSDGVRVLKLIASPKRPSSKMVVVARGSGSFVDASGALTMQLIRSDVFSPCWQSAIVPR